LVRRPATVAVVIAVVALPASTVVVVARAIVVVAVDTLDPPPGLNGVPHIAVGPKAAADCRCRGSASLLALSMLRGGGFGLCADGAPARPHSERWTRRSSPLVVLSPPRAAPSTVGALVAPRRSLPLGSCAAAWPQRQDSATPARRVADHQRRRCRRRSRPRWRVGCCRAPARVPMVLVHSRAATRQLDGAHVGRCSPRRAPPA
jgi:hypothetical protein